MVGTFHPSRSKHYFETTFICLTKTNSTGVSVGAKAALRNKGIRLVVFKSCWGRKPKLPDGLEVTGTALDADMDDEKDDWSCLRQFQRGRRLKERRKTEMQGSGGQQMKCSCKSSLEIWQTCSWKLCHARVEDRTLWQLVSSLKSTTYCCLSIPWDKLLFHQ